MTATVKVPYSVGCSKSPCFSVLGMPPEITSDALVFFGATGDLAARAGERGARGWVWMQTYTDPIICSSCSAR